MRGDPIYRQVRLAYRGPNLQTGDRRTIERTCNHQLKDKTRMGEEG